MEERLQNVEAEIQRAKEEQERYQSWINDEEKRLRQLEEEQDNGVWRVWSLSHC